MELHSLMTHKPHGKHPRKHPSMLAGHRRIVLGSLQPLLSGSSKPLHLEPNCFGLFPLDTSEPGGVSP